MPRPGASPEADTPTAAAAASPLVESPVWRCAGQDNADTTQAIRVESLPTGLSDDFLESEHGSQKDPRGDGLVDSADFDRLLLLLVTCHEEAGRLQRVGAMPSTAGAGPLTSTADTDHLGPLGLGKKIQSEESQCGRGKALSVNFGTASMGEKEDLEELGLSEPAALDEGARMSEVEAAHQRQIQAMNILQADGDKRSMSLAQRLSEEEQGGPSVGPRGTNGKTRVIGNINLDAEVSSRLQKFLRGPFELFMSGIIILNAFSLFISFQCSGYEVGALLGAIDPSSDWWVGHERVFFIVEHMFQAIYISELLLRLSVFGRGFFWDSELKKVDRFNCFDVFIVLVGCLDMYILPLLNYEGSSITFFRVVRLARLSRTFKVVRVLKTFSKVRVLISTVASSFLALSWSMLMLFILMFLGSCFLSQQLQVMLVESEGDIQDTFGSGSHSDLDLWELYGTSTRAFWTLFEITLGAQGTSLARPLVAIHWIYAPFFLFYVSGVVFAVICIIQALFLKDTLEVAANDAEAMVQEQLWHKKELCRKLEQVFLAADASCDGFISPEEFEDVLSIPQVKGFLELLDLEVSEISALFSILDDGDGQISYNEFIQGVMRLKGQARSMDVIAMMRDIKKVIDHLKHIEGLVEHHFTNPTAPRPARTSDASRFKPWRVTDTFDSDPRTSRARSASDGATKKPARVSFMPGRQSTVGACPFTGS